MNLRTLHKLVGLLFSPFFLITAVCGTALLWRKADLYGKATKERLLELHNWEIVAKYVGTALGLALIFMVVSGIKMLLGSGGKRS